MRDPLAESLGLSTAAMKSRLHRARSVGSVSAVSVPERRG